jgi:hypothetical protein
VRADVLLARPPVAWGATVRFGSAIPDPPATYGFNEFAELFCSTSPEYMAVHSWNIWYVITHRPWTDRGD